MKTLLFEENRSFATVLSVVFFIIGLLFRSKRLFYLYFIIITVLMLLYRDDDRLSTNNNKDEIVSPADGKVIFVSDKKVVIFLSVFDMHVQKSPVDGVITNITYKTGEFNPAYLLEKSRYNERNYFDINTINGDRIRVTQVAGQFSRRIVSFKKITDTLKKGESLGMILVGSQVILEVEDAYLPLITEGDYVYAGITPIYRTITI
jgi:phosphatidylserine decarboxylase